MVLTRHPTDPFSDGSLLESWVFDNGFSSQQSVDNPFLPPASNPTFEILDSSTASYIRYAPFKVSSTTDNNGDVSSMVTQNTILIDGYVDCTFAVRLYNNRIYDGSPYATSEISISIGEFGQRNNFEITAYNDSNDTEVYVYAHKRASGLQISSHYKTPYFIVATYNGTTDEIRCYLDGIYIGSFTQAIDFNSSKGVEVTSHRGSVTSDIQYYNRILTQQEITDLAFDNFNKISDTANPRSSTPLDPFSDGQLVESYSFEDSLRNDQDTKDALLSPQLYDYSDLQGKNKVFMALEDVYGDFINPHDLSGNIWTISFGIKNNGLNSSGLMFYSDNDSVQVYLSSESVIGYFTQSGEQSDSTGSVSIPQSEIIVVTFSTNGTDTFFYINGVLEATLNKYYDITTNGRVTIYEYLDSANNTILDELLFFTKCYSDNQIAWLYDYEGDPPLEAVGVIVGAESLLLTLTLKGLSDSTTVKPNVLILQLILLKPISVLKDSIIEYYKFKDGSSDTFYNVDNTNRFLGETILDIRPLELPDNNAIYSSTAYSTEYASGVSGGVSFSASFWWLADTSIDQYMYFNYDVGGGSTLHFNTYGQLAYQENGMVQGTAEDMPNNGWHNLTYIHNFELNRFYIYLDKVLIVDINIEGTGEFEDTGRLRIYGITATNILTFDSALTADDVKTVYDDFKVEREITRIPIASILTEFHNPYNVMVFYPKALFIGVDTRVVTVMVLPIVQNRTIILNYVVNAPTVQGVGKSVRIIDNSMFIELNVYRTSIQGYMTVYVETLDLLLYQIPITYSGESTSDVDLYPKNKVYAQSILLRLVPNYLRHIKSVYIKAPILSITFTKITEGFWERVFVESFILPLAINSSIAQDNGYDRRVLKIGNVEFDRALYWDANISVNNFIATTANTVDGNTVYSVTPLKEYTRSFKISTKSDIIVDLVKITELKSIISTGVVRVWFNDGSWEDVMFDLTGYRIRFNPIFEGSDKYYLHIGVLL